MAVFIKREPCDEPSSTHELQPPLEPVLAEPVPLTSAVLLPKAITSSSAAVLPVAITTAVLEILVRKECPPGYSDFGLSRGYPRGFFEAVEALTFVSEPTWQRFFVEEFTREYFAEFWVAINKPYVQNTLVSPSSRKLLFSAFNLTPLDKVKVVIPAIAPLSGQGYTSDGLAYSVLLPGHNKPPAWGVLKLLSFVSHLHPHSSSSSSSLAIPHSLQAWAKQGVLLWNMTLTSLPDDSSVQEIDTKLTHQAQCARKFYVGVAEVLNRECDKLVFLLFDIKSHGMFKVLRRIISSGNHTVVKGPPLISLQQPQNPMKCFTEVNHNLTAAGKTPIDWLAL